MDALEATYAARLLGKVDRSADCWMWTASVDGSGYGQFHLDGAMRRAHRVMYELFVGPIPDGLVLDHLCREPRCVNPAHLEPVTHAENLRRGRQAQSERTECVNGHPYDEGNTAWCTKGPRAGTRRCRACQRDRENRWKRGL